ncbi:AraC family transcriptional regulator [Bilophila wadsworthia]|uniref:AraC family transcriptional regulator n=1 Tax=Bilophila wadsworthia TaxID=35833 RepID=UPI00266EDCA1|nr:AraC family transcriptional regulator [Bilophila wadsworthia]
MREQRAELERMNEQLKEKILSRMAEPGSHPTAISGFNLVRRVQANELRVFYRPFIGLTVQGFKRTIVGKAEYSYGEYHCFVAGVDMPSESYITVASDEEPFLALSLDLDRSLVAQLAAEIPHPARTEQGMGKSVAVMEADAKVMAAFLRLTELLDEPEEIPIMAPMLIREILYRLLLGPQGAWLRTICSLGTASNQVAQAVTWLRENYKAPLQVEELAQRVGMSSSSFFRNFKQMTTLSPLQFQKTLRLYEAQRLMLTNEYDVASAAYAVGYESSTQFIREYKRMFGDPPRRDVSRKRIKFQ